MFLYLTKSKKNNQIKAIAHANISTLLYATKKILKWKAEPRKFRFLQKSVYYFQNYAFKQSPNIETSKRMCCYGESFVAMSNYFLL